MKKSIILLIALILCLGLFTACGDVTTPPAETPAPTPTSTPTPAPTPTPTPEPTPTETPTMLPETADAGQEYIDKMIFIGDSTTHGLAYYGVVSKNQVWTPSNGTMALFNQRVATIVFPSTGQEMLIVDAVSAVQPEYLVLTIGVNGVSSMSESYFKSEYTDLIQRIQAASPDTKIICNSIYPVEASYEEKGNGINNKKIDTANTWVYDVAEETGTHYTDSATVLKNADGCLDPKYGNGDGLHLNPDGYNRVLNYLRIHAF